MNDEQWRLITSNINFHTSPKSREVSSWVVRISNKEQNHNTRERERLRERKLPGDGRDLINYHVVEK